MVGIPLTSLTRSHWGACPKQEPGISLACVVAFLLGLPMIWGDRKLSVLSILLELLTILLILSWHIYREHRMHTIQIHLTNSRTNQNKPKPNCISENKQHDFHHPQRKKEIKRVLWWDSRASPNWDICIREWNNVI